MGEAVTEERLRLNAFAVNGDDVGELRNLKIKSACVKVPEGRGRGNMSGKELHEDDVDDAEGLKEWYVVNFDLRVRALEESPEGSNPSFGEVGNVFERVL